MIFCVTVQLHFSLRCLWLAGNDHQSCPRYPCCSWTPRLQFSCTVTIKGLADSTHKVYRTGLKGFLRFCHDQDATPFPVSESLMLYFVAFLTLSTAFSLATDFGLELLQLPLAGIAPPYRPWVGGPAWYF